MAKDNYRDLELVRDEDGVLALISEHMPSGRLSFMIAREFERGGETQRTAFLQRRHLSAAHRLLDQLEAKLDTLEDRTREAKRAPVTT